VRHASNACFASPRSSTHSVPGPVVRGAPVVPGLPTCRGAPAWRAASRRANLGGGPLRAAMFPASA
jgi:hypothetical protein